MENKFYTVKEVSKRWGLSEMTIRRMIKKKEISAVRLGRNIRISAEEVKKREELWL